MTRAPVRCCTGSLPRRAEGGFIIVAVLWILAAVAALVLIYSVFTTNTVISVAGSTDRVQDEASMTAAIELAVQSILASGDDARPSRGSFSGRVGPAQISVSYVSEAARIDLNAAPREMLAGLVMGFGVADEDAATMADRIIGWRTPLKGATEDDDPETTVYRNAGMAYLPRHAPFAHVEELLLVAGLPRQVALQMMPFVTVFNGKPSINIRDAEPQVIGALPKMTPEKLQNILSARDGRNADPKALADMTGLGDDTVTLEASRAFRMQIDITYRSGRKLKTEAVVLLIPDGAEPYRLLSRRDNIGTSAPRMAPRKG